MKRASRHSENKKIYSWTLKSKWSGIQTSLNIKLINKKKILEYNSETNTEKWRGKKFEENIKIHISLNERSKYVFNKVPEEDNKENEEKGYSKKE